MTTLTMTYPTTNPWRANHVKDAAFQIAKDVLREFDTGPGLKLFEHMVEKAERDAKRYHEGFLSAVRAGRCSTYKNRKREDVSRDYRVEPEYTRFNAEGVTWPRQHIDSQQRWLKEGRYSVDLEKAKRDAFNLFIDGRFQFFYKIDTKLSSALAGRRKVIDSVGVNLRVSLPVEGSIFVRLDSETEFEVRLQMKQCINEHDTVYWQYPATFHDAVVKGKKVSYPSLEAVANAVGEAYGIIEREPKKAVTKVEPTKQNLKALLTLIYLLVNEVALEKTATERRRRGYMVDTQGPRPQITRNAKKVGLDKDVTEGVVRAVLDASMPQEAKDRLQAMKTQGHVSMGKRGSAEAATDRLLKYLELAEMGEIGDYPNTVSVTIPTTKGKKI